MTRDVKLFGAIAVRPALLDLVDRFRSETGIGVTTEWDLNPAVKKRIEGGEAFDIVVTNPDLVQDLVDLGKVEAGSLEPFGRIGMGVAAKGGSDAIDIGTVDAFKAALKNASSIAFAGEGTSGRHFLELLERLGIAADVKPRLVPVAGGQTAPAVARGDAELGVVPVSAILVAVPEVTLVGLFPEELQSYVDFAIGIGAASDRAEAARRLSDFLLSPERDAVLAAKGVVRG